MDRVDVQLEWVADESPLNSILFKKIKLEQNILSKWIHQLPNGYFYYRVYLKNALLSEVNTYKLIITNILIPQVEIGYHVDDYEDLADYVQYLHEIARVIISHQTNVYVDSFRIVERHINYKLYRILIPLDEDQNKIYGHVSLDLDLLKGYEYLTDDRLIEFLNPKLLVRKYENIYVVNGRREIYRDVDTKEELRVQYQDRRDYENRVLAVKDELNSLKANGFTALHWDYDDSDILNLNIMANIAEMWGMKVYWKTRDGTKSLRDSNMIVIECKAGSTCKELARLFATNLSSDKVETGYGDYMYIPSRDPSTSIREWFFDSVGKIKQGSLPVVRLYGEWQTYQKYEFPLLSYAAIKTYLKMFPSYEKWGKFRIASDMSIQAEFATVDDLYNYRSSMLDLMDDSWKWTTIRLKTFKEAVLTRWLINRPDSLVVEVRGVCYVVVEANINYVPPKTFDELKEKLKILINSFEGDFNLKRSTLDQLYTYALEDLDSYALRGYYAISPFSGILKTLPESVFVPPPYGTIEIKEVDSVQEVNVVKEGRIVNQLLRIKTDEVDLLRKYVETIWKQGRFFNLFATEYIQTKEELPAYIGDLGPEIRKGADSIEAGLISMKYLMDLF